jgi:hypothetical protein
MTNIFICWSGERSRGLGEALRAHLPEFVPGLAEVADLFISGDIAKGTRWFDEVERELDNAGAGLVCVTREALQSGWLHFEAGALARAVRRNKAHGEPRGGALYTYLLGVQPDELKGPLAEFQSTGFDRDDTKKFCAAIVSSMGQSAPPREAWEKAFDAKWPAFSERVKAIGPLPAADLIPDLEEIFRRKTFDEPLDECTRQSWIDRFAGVRETMAGLRMYRPILKADDSYLLDLYNDLLGELDGYAMNMGALLLEEKRFQVDPESGTLVIGNGIKRACEGRRGRIRKLLTHLLAPNCAPVLEEESRRYAKMTSFEAKKTILIHPIEREIQQEYDQQKDRRVTAEELSACAASRWEFDRIYFYLVQEKSDSPRVDQLAESLEQEFESLRAVDGGSSLIPLHYVIRALKKTCQRPALGADVFEYQPRIRQRLTSIRRFLEDGGLDKGKQVTENIDEFLGLLDGPARDVVGSAG